MQSAAKLGITITVSQVGSEISSAGTTTVCTPGMTNDWQSSFTHDEDGLLHQLRANLVQTLDSCMCKLVHLFFIFMVSIGLLFLVCWVSFDIFCGFSFQQS